MKSKLRLKLVRGDKVQDIKTKKHGTVVESQNVWDVVVVQFGTRTRRLPRGRLHLESLAFGVPTSERVLSNGKTVCQMMNRE